MELVSLDARGVRDHMIAEIDRDIANGTLYLSGRLTDAGQRDYPKLLRAAAAKGSPASLTEIIRGLFRARETATRNGKTFEKDVPVTAPESLAQGEFNRFYIRAVSLAAIAQGQTEVEVYRAQDSAKPRPESEARIGARIEATKLLADLRSNIGVDTALGVPGGVNSGLSVRLLA